MCREGAWDELAVRVTSGIAIRSGMLVKKSCRADMIICCTRLFCLRKFFINGQNAIRSRVSSERSQGIYECTYKSADGGNISAQLRYGLSSMSDASEA